MGGPAHRGDATGAKQLGHRQCQHGTHQQYRDPAAQYEKLMKLVSDFIDG